jgi:hypothetical protein
MCTFPQSPAALKAIVGQVMHDQRQHRVQYQGSAPPQVWRNVARANQKLLSTDIGFHQCSNNVRHIEVEETAYKRCSET